VGHGLDFQSPPGNGRSFHNYLVPTSVSSCHLNSNCYVAQLNILVSLFAVFLRYCKLSSEPFWLTFSDESQPTVAKCQQYNYPREDSTPPLPLSVSFFHVANDEFPGKAQQVLALLCVSGSFQALLISNEGDISLEYPLRPISDIN